MRIYVLPGHGHTDYIVRSGAGNDTLARITDDGACHVAPVLTELGVTPSPDVATFENRLRRAGFKVLSPGERTQALTVETARAGSEATRNPHGPQPLTNNLGDALRAAGWAV